MTVEQDRIDLELIGAAEDLQTARNAQAAAIDRAKRATLVAIKAGVTEVNVAQALGVNRLTVRRWLGK